MGHDDLHVVVLETHEIGKISHYECYVDCALHESCVVNADCDHHAVRVVRVVHDCHDCCETGDEWNELRSDENCESCENFASSIDHFDCHRNFLPLASFAQLGMSLAHDTDPCTSPALEGASYSS